MTTLRQGIFFSVCRSFGILCAGGCLYLLASMSSNSSVIQYAMSRAWQDDVAANAGQDIDESTLPSVNSCQRISKELSCRALFSYDADQTIVSNAKLWNIPDSEVLTLEIVINLATNCSGLITRLELIMTPLTVDEAEFPLAYTWLVYKNIHQIVMILRRVYRPQNFYCIHVDRKSEEIFQQAIEALARCLPNLVFPKERFEVNYLGVTILQANYACMKRLHELEPSWKYVQTLTGTDFPLRTNAEMVEMFKIFNGTADNDGEPLTSTFMVRVSRPLPIPPGGLTIYLGNTGVALSREFVRFLFTNPIALEFYNWSLHAMIPDEIFFTTLMHNLHLDPPGGYPGMCLFYFLHVDKVRKPFMARYQAWPETSPCEGKQGPTSCIFGVGDLPLLVRKPHLLAHKFEMDFQPAALYCLDELICQRTLDPEHKLHAPYDFGFNASFYKTLPSVEYHNMPDKSKYECRGFNVV